MTFDRSGLATHLKSLARENIFVGTSSWKYRGWCGTVYDEARYVWKGRFAASRFERLCLAEYAETFKTVCLDSAYYKFPTGDSLKELAAQVPDDFKFAFKVTDEITLKKFTNLPRFGPRAGKQNENFLNAGRFASEFLLPCEPIKSKVGLLIFEFSHFYSSDFERGRDFVQALASFLSKLPTGWPYGVEIRNKEFLRPEYFDALRKHNVTHVYNSWAGMPSVGEQMNLDSSRTAADLWAARFLLKPGRKYQEAVDLFAPYTEIKEINQEARDAGAKLLQDAKSKKPRRGAYIFVNNRLEGSAPMTIQAMVEQSNQP